MAQTGPQFSLSIWQMPGKVTTRFPAGLEPVMEGIDIEAVASSPAHSDTLFIAYGGLFKNVMAPNWNRWSQNHVYQTPPVTAICVSRRQPSVICLGTENRGIVRSDDGGISWSETAAPIRRRGLITQIAEDATGRLLAATVDGLIASSDLGRDWSLLAPEYFWHFAVDGGTPPTIYGTPDGETVLKSTDGGQTWGATYGTINNAPRDVSASRAPIAVHPRSGSIVYAAPRNRGVVRSVDGGKTWHALNTGLMGTVSALSIDPGSPTRLYAGTAEGQVFELISPY